MSDNEPTVEMQGAVCPIPLQQKSTIVMGHGSGGKMMHDLIADVFVSAFDNPMLDAGNDAGWCHPKHGKCSGHQHRCPCGQAIVLPRRRYR